MTFDHASFCYTLTSVDGQSPELKAAYKWDRGAKLPPEATKGNGHVDMKSVAERAIRDAPEDPNMIPFDR
ncbi:hypothetical protein N7452_003911 [Penicillium brevicompactum]|uniref:Uncharacterized protein n=1 Tax=Penicillium brevicompactum TaxID=5074 RepID=A0A9W9UKF2_PENBR|nr:hypothetical protein N7452_003911 [Penicillium brevicompactum]